MIVIIIHYFTTMFAFFFNNYLVLALLGLHFKGFLLL